MSGLFSGGPYTKLPSDCSEWSWKHKCCSRGIEQCPCPLFEQLSYTAGSLRDWVERAVAVQRAEGRFEPDQPSGPPGAIPDDQMKAA